MNTIEKTLIAQENSRADLICSNQLDLSRSYINKLIKEGCLYVNDIQIKKPSYIVNKNSVLKLLIPEVEENILPENIPLNIIYEDDELLVLNKDSGITVHPSSSIKSGTLVNSLLYNIDSLSTINGNERPGIVHRLDKDTSGIIIVAKNDNSHVNLAKQIKNHEIKKYYIALVEGTFKNNTGIIINPIARSKKDRKKMSIDSGGRYAETHWQKIAEYNNSTLLLVRIITGRTHQIRIHMKSINHPIIGDVIYNRKKTNTRLMLHAYRLVFTHPITKNIMDLKADIPNDFIHDVIKNGYLIENINKMLKNIEYLI